MKRSLLSLALLSLFLSPTVIFAETISPIPNSSTNPVSIKETPILKTTARETLEKKAEAAKQLLEKKVELLKDRREASKEAFLEKKEARIEVWEKKKEAIQTKIEQKREANKKTQEIKKEQLKEKLSSFKDKKKAEKIEQVNKNLNLINEKQTKAMSEYLQRLADIIEKLEKGVNGEIPNGKNVDDAEAAIAQAKGAIAVAGEIVANQAGKDYSLTASGETKIQVEAKNTRDKLHTDLETARQSVVNAKQTLTKAIEVSAKLLGK